MMTTTVATKKGRNELRTRPDQRVTARQARRPILPLETAPNKPRLSPAQVVLAATHWRWARWYVRGQVERYEHLGLPPLDWEGAAEIGLCDAAFGFQPDRDTDFKSYARVRLYYAVIDLLRAESLRGYRRGSHGKPPTVESFDRSMPLIHACRMTGRARHGKEQQLHSLVTLYSVVPSGDTVGGEIQALDSFERMIKQLPLLYREVIRRLYRDEESMTEIARRLRCSLSRVSQMHTQSLAWLREALSGKAVPA